MAAALLLALILPLALQVQSSGLQPGSYSPASAYDPESNLFLLVFTDVDYYGIPGIYGLLVGPDASPIGTPTRISDPDAYINGRAKPSVAFNKNDNVFLVSWHDLREGSSDIYASIVEIGVEIGVNIGAEIADATGDSIIPQDDFAVYAGYSSEAINPVAAYSPEAGNFLIAWQEASQDNDYDIYARALFYEDNYISEVFPVYSATGRQGDISIAASHDGSSYFLAFEDYSAGLPHPTISGQIIDAHSLELISSAKLGLDVSGNEQGGYAPSVSSISNNDISSEDGMQFIIAWSGPDGEIRARYMNDSDNSIYPFDTVFEPEGRQEGPATKVSASYDDSTLRAVLVWQELKEHDLHDIYYMFLEGQGNEGQVYHIGTVTAEEDMDELGIAISYNSRMPSFLLAYEYTNNIDTFNILLSTISDPDYPEIKVNDPVWPFEDLTLGYPGVLYNSAVSHTLNVYNDSPYAELNISNISAEGPFMVTGDNCTLGPLVPAGTPCAVTVEFAPLSGGPATGSLSIESDDPNEPGLTLHLSGMGLAPDIRVKDTLMPDNDMLLNFGSIKVGHNETATVTINNKGNHTLFMGSLMVMAGGFEITRDDCSMQALMPEQGFCTFDVLAAPVTEGQRSGTIWLHSDDPLKPALALGLMAEGTLPEFSLSSDNLYFGFTHIGQKALKEFRIHNTGGAALSIDSVTIDGEAFSIEQNSCARDIAPNGYCTITLGFYPTGLFGYEGRLAISSEGSEHAVKLDGNGAVPIAATERSVDFQSVTLDDPSLKSIRVTNLGQVPLTAWAEDIDGAGFTVIGDECADTSLTYSASCDIHIEMLSHEAGLYAGTLGIGTSDPDERLITVSISGMAVPGRTTVLGQFFYGYEN